MRLSRSIPLSLTFCALLGGTALVAQNSAGVPRITARIDARIDASSLTTLGGNVSRMARSEFDRGEAAPSTELSHMRLVLARSAAQQAALDQYLAGLQDPASPNYHKWLTPAEFGQLYGPADADIVTLVSWLQAQGFTVDPVPSGRTDISFSGSVRQAEAAFHTSIHTFNANGTQFYANTTDPQIPSAFAPVVAGVAHLNTLRPAPQLAPAGAGRFDPGTQRMEPLESGASAQATEAAPDLTISSGGYYYLYVVPADAATIYNTPNSLNVNYSGTNYTGAGVKIGIGGDATISAGIVENYRSTFLGSSTEPTIYYCTSSTSCSSTSSGKYVSDDVDEAYLDTELSGGMAPGASIYYYASPDLISGIEAAIEQNVVDIFSLSFGECEQNMSTSDNEQIANLWQQAAGEGIAVTVSAGDSGSAGCDGDNASPETVAQDGLSVSGFASTPYNIAIGGTDFYPLVNDFSAYASESQGSASSDYYRTANGYIPESTWNDSSYYNTTISDDVPLSDAGQGYSASQNNIVAGSGGHSSCSTNNSVDNSNGSVTDGSCVSGYAKPSWQTGTGIYDTDGVRDIPDVSLMSGNGFDGAAWLVCTSDTDKVSGVEETTNCATQSNGSFYFTAFGGTSTAAPAFAGILALVQQAQMQTTGCTGVACRLGNAAQTLYELYNGAYASNIFHDVTVGNNSVSCTSGTPDCDLNAAGYYFESGYDTGTGYDLATGMGSVNATQLVNDWASAVPTIKTLTPTVTVTSVSPNPATTVQQIAVVISVSGSGATPTGTISLTSDSYNSFQTIAASGSCTAASCTFTVPAGSLTIGTDTLAVVYGGDSNYFSATNAATVTVNGLTTTVSINSLPASIDSNQSLTVTGTVTGAGPTPTGTVTLFGGGYTSPAATLSSGSYSITIPVNSLSTGNDTLTVTYSGNSIYTPGTSDTAQVTVDYVAVLTPTVTVTPQIDPVSVTAQLPVIVSVSGSGATPTGTITLTGSYYSSGAVTIASSGSCTAASCAIAIPANSLTVGANTLTATYSGDGNYKSASNTAAVTVTPEAAFTLNQTAPVVTPGTIAPGSSATATITATAENGYTGTVALSCALASYPPGANDLPSCSGGSAPVTLSSAATSGTATVTVGTTATTSELVYPKLPGRHDSLLGAGSGAVLAFLVFLGVPARRRGWRSMLGLLAILAVLGSLSACSGSGTTTTTTTGSGGTTAGTYTFTISGTGNPAISPAPTAQFSVTVQ